MELVHFSHDHPLVFNEKESDDGQQYTCFGCLNPILGPHYSCTQCMRFLHKSCAELPRKIEHPMHPEHALTLHKEPPNPYLLCKCDACQRVWGCFTYHCSDCNVDLDVNCVSFPHSIEYGGHEHPLTVWPKPASFSCDACGTTHSEECRYVAHLNCATSESQPQRDDMTQINVGDHLPNLINLPVPDETVDLISHIFKEISLEGDVDRVKGFKHFSHEHQLTLVDVQSDNVGSCESRNELKTIEICDGCARPISAPFYSCAQCKYFLHKWCAKLPNELQHPIHQDHPLTLLAKSPDFYGLFKCGICFNFCNGFSFHCSPCNINLDVNCGSYPSTITHEAHNHPLKLRLNLQDWCSACNQAFVGFIYECAPCSFKIDIQCAKLPRMLWHRYDEEHPLILTYSLVEEHLNKFYCEFCEKEIFKNFWFYHCADCRLHAHTRCIYKVDDAYSNVKFGGTLDLSVHPHLLTFVQKTLDKPPCERCGDPCNDLAFTCGDCNYNLHPNCASMYSNESS
ncbi:hypothetical protein F0562_015838 [Nyssa sinensis]|uniref:DC1 domain-containing protein n=1 Tax=Nyssa sinensis TaxID=561372 RepID=A0A5J4ZJQ7_9ASTE|nr:hypothetical protein F0562_015838 [Nyssa sinensis]